MKKVVISFLLGIFLISLTACGNKTVKKDVVAQFENSVFIGDSITEGFSFNEILPSERVIAGAGTTAGFVYDDVDVLAELKPDHIYIMLGSIDLYMPVDDPQDLFRADLTKLVTKIKDIVPTGKIYLQSITPVTQEALDVEPRYREIEEYNQILQEVAATLAVSYVDIGVLARDNRDLYAEDGIHFKKEFYQLWLETLAELM